MANKARTETININLFSVVCRLDNSMNVVITFFGRRSASKNDESRVEVNVTMRLWWLRILKRELTSVVRDAQEQLDETGFNDQ